MKKLLIVMFCCILLNTCRKYEEGPMISFRSRTSRVVNDWTVYSVYKNGIYEANDTALGSKYVFTGEGRFNINDSTKGSWRFISDYEELYLEFDDKSTPKKFDIKKLKEKEMWVSYIDTSVNSKIELRMK